MGEEVVRTHSLKEVLTTTAWKTLQWELQEAGHTRSAVWMQRWKVGQYWLFPLRLCDTLVGAILDLRSCLVLSSVMDSYVFLLLV